MVIEDKCFKKVGYHRNHRSSLKFRHHGDMLPPEKDLGYVANTHLVLPLDPHHSHHGASHADLQREVTGKKFLCALPLKKTSTAWISFALPTVTNKYVIIKK